MKLKLQGPREKGRCALVELHMQHPECKRGAVSLGKMERNALVSQQLQGSGGQEQLIISGKMHKRCLKEEQQSSNPQEGADSLEESDTHLCPVAEVQVQNLGSWGKGLVLQ